MRKLAPLNLDIVDFSDSFRNNLMEWLFSNMGMQLRTHKQHDSYNDSLHLQSFQLLPVWTKRWHSRLDIIAGKFFDVLVYLSVGLFLVWKDPTIFDLLLAFVQWRGKRRESLDERLVLLCSILQGGFLFLITLGF